MEDRPAERPRLNLKPRDEAAAKQAEAERQKKLTHNPFGDAKPRETVLATRTGKSEEEILKENVRQERLRLRLNSQQTEEKETLEALVSEVKGQMEQEEDEGTRIALKALLTDREAAVEELMDKFAKQALEAAAKGEVQRPSERRALAGVHQGGPGGHHPHHPVGSPGAGGGGAHFGSAFEHRERGGYSGGSYRDGGGSGGYREAAGYDHRGGAVGGGSGRYHPTRGPGAPQGGYQGGYRDAASGGEGRQYRDNNRQSREAPAYDRGGGRGGAGGGRPPYQPADRYIPADTEDSGGYRNGGSGGRGGYNGYKDSVEGRAPTEFATSGRTASGGGRYNDDDDYLPGMPGVRAGGMDRGFERSGFDRPGFGSVSQDRY